MPLGPPLGVIRWDGYELPDPEWAPTSGFTGLKAKHKHRLPRHWAPNFGQYGTGVDEQAIIDAELLDYANTGCFWWFDNYPTEADIAGDSSSVSAIQTAFNCYMASPNKGLVKFALILQPTWLAWPGAFEHYAAQLATIAALVADPQYQRVEGKPVIGLFGVLDETSYPLARHSELIAAIGEPIFGVSVTHSNSSTTTYSLLAGTTYGPNPTNITGTARNPYQAQHTRDKVFWGAVPGARCSIGFNPTNNGGPISGPRSFADWPTLPEWMRALREGFIYAPVGLGRAVIGSIYSHSEIAEGGGLNMAQFVSPTTGKSYILDGLEYATQRALRPPSYQYEISASNLGGAVAHSGTGWTTKGPTQGGTLDGSQVDGAHDSDEERSSTTADAITFTHEAMRACDLFATVGPDRGQISVAVDGGAPLMVELYAPAQVVHSLVWSSAPLATATHAIVVTVLGTKHASSSSVLVGVDSFRPTFDVRQI